MRSGDVCRLFSSDPPATCCGGTPEAARVHPGSPAMLVPCWTLPALTVQAQPSGRCDARRGCHACRRVCANESGGGVAPAQRIAVALCQVHAGQAHGPVTAGGGNWWTVPVARRWPLQLDFTRSPSLHLCERVPFEDVSTFSGVACGQAQVAPLQEVPHAWECRGPSSRRQFCSACRRNVGRRRLCRFALQISCIRAADIC